LFPHADIEAGAIDVRSSRIAFSLHTIKQAVEDIAVEPGAQQQQQVWAR